MQPAVIRSPLGTTGSGDATRRLGRGSAQEVRSGGRQSAGWKVPWPLAVASRFAYCSRRAVAWRPVRPAVELVASLGRACRPHFDRATSVCAVDGRSVWPHW